MTPLLTTDLLDNNEALIQKEQLRIVAPMFQRYGGKTAFAGSAVTLQVRLQQPHVDPQKCIGCGVCEHECPVLGLRAIRVTAENESRAPHHRLVL